MSLRRIVSVCILFAVACCAPLALMAQAQDLPKAEIFGGYSYHYDSSVVVKNDNSFPAGWGAAFSYNLKKNLDLGVDISGHYNNAMDYHTFTAGPQFKFRRGAWTPFLEAMPGVALVALKAQYGQTGNQKQISFSAVAGGGLDYRVTPRLSYRVIQADYVNAWYQWPHGTDTFNGIRLQTGLVLTFGVVTTPKVPATVACAAQPTAVDAGAPVTVTATPAGFNPKRVLSYAWSLSGGKIDKSAATVNVDTTGLAPGAYTAGVTVMDDGKGKNMVTVSCKTGFSINEPPKHPPVLSITVEPSSLKQGDSATITARGSSPDNRPLSYSCKASAGQLSGNGPAYTLGTVGVPEGNVNVNCTVSDDRNLTASAAGSLHVSVPPPPPVAKDFGNVGFTHDKKRPARIDNEAKGELDRFADALTQAPDSHAVIVGYATAEETKVKKGKKAVDMAAERAVNAKDYLTREKGIDPRRIETRTGASEQKDIDLWIVPPDANFPAGATKPVDETKVKAVPRTITKAMHHTKMAKKPAPKADATK